MLTFNLKKEWFDKIKSGEKTHEYREVKYYWSSRIVTELYKPKNKRERKGGIELLKMQFETFGKKEVAAKVCFMNGMETEENRPRMYGTLKSIDIVDGMNTDLKIKGPVYDFEFELVGNNHAELP